MKKKELRKVIEAGKILHDAKPRLPYNYATIDQRDLIRDAEKIWKEYWESKQDG